MDTKKINYTDNFSDFLNEYNNKSEDRRKWINEKIFIIEKCFNELLLPESKVTSEINCVIKILNSKELEEFQKIKLSLKEINTLIRKADEKQDDSISVNSLRTVITTYIEIARLTSNEEIATDTVGIMKALINKLKI